jgi:hypothetical protein
VCEKLKRVKNSDTLLFWDICPKLVAEYHMIFSFLYLVAEYHMIFSFLYLVAEYHMIFSFLYISPYPPGRKRVPRPSREIRLALSRYLGLLGSDQECIPLRTRSLSVGLTCARGRGAEFLTGLDR